MGISVYKIAAGLGGGLAVLGVVLMGAALWRCHYRERWFFFFLIVWSLATMLALSQSQWSLDLPAGERVILSLGFLPGAAFLIYLFLHRAEFLGEKKAAN